VDLDGGSPPLGLQPFSAASSADHPRGTLRYMSPEAIAAGPSGPSFDLWSLSFVLYEALTGRHPFATLSAGEMADAIRRSAIPDVRDLCPDCPASLAAFFRDALSPVETRRPASAADLRRHLQGIKAHTGLR
jgi:serine/threonine-protein kinase